LLNDNLARKLQQTAKNKTTIPGKNLISLALLWLEVVTQKLYRPGHLCDAALRDQEISFMDK
jgi:hypothetical protein